MGRHFTMQFVQIKAMKLQIYDNCPIFWYINYRHLGIVFMKGDCRFEPWYIHVEM